MRGLSHGSFEAKMVCTTAGFTIPVEQFCFASSLGEALCCCAACIPFLASKIMTIFLKRYNALAPGWWLLPEFAFEKTPKFYPVVGNSGTGWKLALEGL